MMMSEACLVYSHLEPSVMKKNIPIALLLSAAFAGGALILASPGIAADGDGRTKTKADHPNKAERQQAREKARGDKADNREARQAKRIENGIKKGALTQDELDTLTKQQKSIGDLEDSIKGDGKVTKDEAKQLKDALDTASRNIWGDKHNTEGNQLPTYRLGDNVFAKDDFTSKMSDPNLSKTDARKLTHDFHHLIELKHSLASDDLTPEQRSKKQAEFNDLLNQYFEVRAK
jgi:hypothetical protein